MTAGKQLDTFAAAAGDLARQGGRLALDRLGKTRSSRKADKTIVTDADLAVQRLIIEAVAKRFPTHAVLGEEARDDEHRLPGPGQAEFCWVIDPIDGTRNYCRGYPCFCTSVALLREGWPIIGAIYDPLLERLYHGVVGRGAFLNDEPLRARDAPLYADSLMGVPSGHSRKMPGAVHLWMDRLNLRNSGSTALHLAYVAAGWLDAAYAYECKIWDVGAGWLLVREAGGVITRSEGAELFPADPAALAGRNMPFLAAGPKRHAQLLEMLAGGDWAES